MQKQWLGICLQPALIPDVAITRPNIGWVEFQAENCIEGGGAVQAATALRCDYDISLHSVGLSLGSADGIDSECLRHISSLNASLEPGFVSDHLSWSKSGGNYLSALLPLPNTFEALEVVCRNIDEVQSALKKRILIENISAYVRFSHSEISEPDFLMEAVRRTGCGVLLDVNNVFVNCANFDNDPLQYLRSLSPSAICQYHLGGHSRIACGTGSLLFDDHNAPVDDAVWHLYRGAVSLFGPKPTFVEWETSPPSLPLLMGELGRAGEIIEECCAET